MTKEDKIFQMALAMAPVFAQEGLDLLEKVHNNGYNPAEVTIEGKDIIHSHGHSLKLWATAFVEEIDE